ncbi:MAG TPA: hypothetical protein PLA90_11630 [Candidatus Sumerlaeota bacterium]|nr:hypothetical protein [Candidatus Sumerlaeota bacterium]HPS02184.1 hypothetical protein [Candidatus Sumerlaeota bacterium]
MDIYIRMIQVALPVFPPHFSTILKQLQIAFPSDRKHEQMQPAIHRRGGCGIDDQTPGRLDVTRLPARNLQEEGTLLFVRYFMRFYIR